jgi:4'-phosphopantetheinyl transferase EntD
MRVAVLPLSARSPRELATVFALRRALESLLPRGAFGAIARVVDHPEPSDLAEAAQLGPHVVAKRRAEFAAGRAAAHTALAILPRPPAYEPILSGTHGSPRWPVGFAGSISHNAEWAIAVAAPISAVRSLGVDIEGRAAADEDILDLVARPRERGFVRTDRPGWSLRLSLLFGAKEAAYKAAYPFVGRPLDFSDVELTWLGRERAFATEWIGVPDALGHDEPLPRRVHARISRASCLTLAWAR